MRHVIAAGDRTTAEAARAILEDGGNAFDGAVAASFTAMVAEPTLTSPGGGGYLMACPVEGKPILFDFFVDMPSGRLRDKDLDFFSVDVDFGEAVQQFHIGKGSAAVPGNVAGLLHVHEMLGSVPLKTVMEPAIIAAKEGVPLSDTQAYLVKILAPILTHEAEGRYLFAPGGNLLKSGDRIVMPEFSDFLDVLAHEGAELVYKGDVAKIIVRWAKDGGLILAEDLERYRVRERNPLTTPFRGYSIFLNPPPALSGILIDYTFSLLEATEPARRQPIPLKSLVYAFEETDRVRREKLCSGILNERFRPLSKEECFDISMERLSNMRDIPATESNLSSMGSTTHISILDSQGNGASVTSTIGEGCGYILPEAGFMLNNMLGEEDINPGGFHKYAAGARLCSMLAPTVIVEEGKPILLTGSAGSIRIRPALVQLIVNHLCNGMSIEEATAAPRVHLDGNVLHAEPGVSEDELEVLEKRYEVDRWPEQNLFFGGANSAAPECGAGDPRRCGVSIVL